MRRSGWAAQSFGGRGADALGERDALVRDAERGPGQALATMTDKESLSLREAVEWCGSGVTVREIVRLLRPDGGHQGGRDG
jgi:hypothetical protein